MKESGVLDKILEEIGNFGLRQFAIIAQICLIIFLISANHISFVFNAMDQEYRCFIPGCDKTDMRYDMNIFEEKWLKHAIPFNNNNKPEKCQMFGIFENSTFEKNCSTSIFNQDSILRCNSFVFEDNTNYLGREFNVLCPENKWKLSMIGSINSAGLFVGVLVSGFISDRYGRKLVLLAGTSISGVIGIMKTFSPNYVTFCILEFLDQFFAAGTLPSCFILGAEMVTAEKRMWTGCAIFVSYALGEVFVAITAWILKDWRLIIYTLYIPTIMTVFLYWTIPESCRWCLSKGETEKPIKILKKFAQSNGKEIPSDLLKNINVKEEDCETITIVEMMKSRSLALRFINCCFLWMSCSFLYYGLTINAVNLSENSYMDFIYISLIEIPAYCFSNYLMTNFGRKISLSGTFFLAAISCATFAYVEQDDGWLQISIYCLGKFGVTAAFYLVYYVTNECFPTSLRQSSMGICSTLARLASITSPQIPLLSGFWKPLPTVLFSSIATISGILSLFLPETANLTLPDTLQEAECIGKKTEEEISDSNKA